MTVLLFTCRPSTSAGQPDVDDTDNVVAPVAPVPACTATASTSADDDKQPDQSATSKKFEFMRRFAVEDDDENNNDGSGGTITLMVQQQCLSKLVAGLKCPECSMPDLFVMPSNQKDGFVVKLKTCCGSCGHVVTEVYTSERVASVVDDHHPFQGQRCKTAFEINRRCVLAGMDNGMGWAGWTHICRYLNMPCLVNSAYHKNQTDLILELSGCIDTFLKQAAYAVRENYIKIDPSLGDPEDENLIINISISFDGSWLTRGKGGHLSNIGLGVIIDLLTGLAIDYAVLCKYCQACTMAIQRYDKESEEFKAWVEKHENCDKNWAGSANAMEQGASEILWKRSIEKHRFRYTEMIGDGDSSTYKNLVKLNVYGDDHPIIKEECVNHISKRFGKGLRELVKDKRKEGMTLGGKGTGKLTAGKIDKLTVYYGRAVRGNSTSVDDMRKAIMAGLFHSISTDSEPHHSRCPNGEESWCFYNRAKAKGETPGPHAKKVHTFLNHEVGAEVLEVYRRLSNPELLSRCLKGKTQNTNECLHSKIWAKCKKIYFYGRKRVETCAGLAISEYNNGRTNTMGKVMEEMMLEMGNYGRNLSMEADDSRLKGADRSEVEKLENMKQKRRQARILENQAITNKEGQTYVAGGF
jgi:hypothetical protein